MTEQKAEPQQTLRFKLANAACLFFITATGFYAGTSILLNKYIEKLPSHNNPERPAVMQNLDQARDYASSLGQKASLLGEMSMPYSSEKLKPFIDGKNAQRKQELSGIEKEIATVTEDIAEMEKNPEVRNYIKNVEETNLGNRKVREPYQQLAKKQKSLAWLCGLGIMGTVLVGSFLKRYKD